VERRAGNGVTPGVRHRIPAGVWDAGAAEYAAVSPELPLYRETAEALVALCEPKRDAVAIDLACGSSCIVTRRLLAHPLAPARIYCVDYSAGMLAAAAPLLRDPRLRGIVSAAEELDRNVGEPAGAVYCNSALVLFDLERALEAIARALAPGGRLAFSIAEDWTGESSPASPKYEAIDRELAARGLPPKPHRSLPSKLSQSALERALRAAGFALEARQSLDVRTTPRDLRAFYSIPSFATMSLPQLPVAEAREVLRAAMQRLDGCELPPERVFLFRARAGVARPSSG
jgi:SAM-dependent methyltransferase